jgi:hypothetical protein
MPWPPGAPTPLRLEPRQHGEAPGFAGLGPLATKIRRRAQTIVDAQSPPGCSGTSKLATTEGGDGHPNSTFAAASAAVTKGAG